MSYTSVGPIDKPEEMGAPSRNNLIMTGRPFYLSHSKPANHISSVLILPVGYNARDPTAVRDNAMFCHSSIGTAVAMVYKCTVTSCFAQLNSALSPQRTLIVFHYLDRLKMINVGAFQDGSAAIQT